MSNTYKYRKYKKKYLELKRDHKFLTNMETAVNSLMNSSRSFVFVDTDINESDMESIETVFSIDNVINDDLDYNYYGIFDESKIKNEMDIFLRQITNNSKKIAQIINKVAKGYTYATKKNYIWLTIRIRYPTNRFDIPRWHYDGYFYNVDEYIKKGLPQIKLAGVLKGPVTLFKTDNQKMFLEYQQLWRNLYKIKEDYKKDIENREIINNELKGYETITPKKNQAAIFKVGSNAAIHSEPKIDTNRLFYSVLSGTREEIKDLASRWNVPFNDESRS